MKHGVQSGGINTMKSIAEKERHRTAELPVLHNDGDAGLCCVFFFVEPNEHLLI